MARLTEADVSLRAFTYIKGINAFMDFEDELLIAEKPFLWQILGRNINRKYT